MMESKVRHNEGLWDTKDVARFLKVAESNIRSRVLSRTIPFLKVGRLVRFQPEQIEAWLREQPSGEQAA